MSDARLQVAPPTCCASNGLPRTSLYDTGSKPPKARSIYSYLRGVQPYYKTQIGRAFRESLASKGVGRAAGRRFPCNRETREALADAIFRIEDELESRRGGQSDLSAVIAMRRARHQVEADLGWGPSGNGEPGNE